LVEETEDPENLPQLIDNVRRNKREIKPRDNQEWTLRDTGNIGNKTQNKNTQYKQKTQHRQLKRMNSTDPRFTIFRKAPPSVVSGYEKRSINLNKVVATC
jgi:hypothetical protein